MTNIIYYISHQLTINLPDYGIALPDEVNIDKSYIMYMRTLKMHTLKIEIYLCSMQFFLYEFFVCPAKQKFDA